MQPRTLRDRVAAWQDLLDECGRKPTRKRVHALRVVTLRLQAELEHDAGELPRASHQAQAMQQFGKLAEKLREVLAPVREFDVWTAKLQRLRASLAQNAGYVPRSTKECIRQIGRLENRLKKKRRSAAQKLVSQIAKRRGDLLAVSDGIDELTSDPRHGADAHIVDTLLKQFAVVAADFPVFDEENLHDFRKRIKKVRYLAEIHQNSDPICLLIAALMKKVQTAIGEWHDWQVLSRSIRHGRDGKDIELGELLNTLAAERLGEALDVCHGANVRMHELQARSVQDLDRFPRKPPVQNGQVAPASLRRLA